jgi:outer membrane lipopolysaccharide assembly protein LptE/RlpB
MTMRRSFRWFVLTLLGASLAACHFHHHRGGGSCFSPPVRHCR